MISITLISNNGNTNNNDTSSNNSNRSWKALRSTSSLRVSDAFACFGVHGRVAQGGCIKCWSNLFFGV